LIITNIKNHQHLKHFVSKSTPHPHQKTSNLQPKMRTNKHQKLHLKQTPKSDKKDVNPNHKSVDQRQAETLNFK